MSFKNQIQQDLAVFFNQDEFADTHTIDGKPVKAIIEESTLTGHPLPYAEGVFLSRQTVYIARSELGYLPEEGQRINLDGKYRAVGHAVEEDGMVILQLEANET